MINTDFPGFSESNRILALIYSGDQLHRIVQARSLTGFGTMGYAQRSINPQAYDVDYSYDPNEDQALRNDPFGSFQREAGMQGRH